MRPYTPGKPISEVKRELGLAEVIKLASNENPLGPSPKAIAAVEKAAREMHLYPDGAAFDLRQALSRHLGLPGHQIVLGNGSDELIHLLGLVLLGSEQDEIIVGDPSFVRYDAAAELAPAKLFKVPLNSAFTHDLSAMAARATENTKLIFVANPNNPTGTIVRKTEFDSFLKDLPRQAVVVLDEAYYEFASDVPGFPNALDYVQAGLPVVCLRTFSKAYGLAGIRVGYGFSSAEIIDGLERARAPFNVNSLAQAAAVAALADQDHVRRTVETNRAGMKRLVKCLESHGAGTCESFGNFVFADLDRPSADVFQGLLQRGIVIRGGEMFGTPNCVRITVGTDEEVTACCSALDEVLGAQVAARA